MGFDMYVLSDNFQTRMSLALHNFFQKIKEEHCDFIIL